MEIQAIANVTDVDVAQAISELPGYEISDLFLQVAERLDNPDVIKVCAGRLLRHCQTRYGVTVPDIPGFEGTLEALQNLST